jgi:hypothetical protein
VYTDFVHLVDVVDEVLHVNFGASDTDASPLERGAPPLLGLPK